VRSGFGEYMPIKVEEAKKYDAYSEDEVKIVNFLTKNRGNAFAEEEVMRGIGKIPVAYPQDEKGSYWTWRNVGEFAVAVVNGVSFRQTLGEMVKKGRIKVSEVAGKIYYYLE
jgi:hypothetical protein